MHCVEGCWARVGIVSDVESICIVPVGCLTTVGCRIDVESIVVVLSGGSCSSSSGGRRDVPASLVRDRSITSSAQLPLPLPMEISGSMNSTCLRPDSLLTNSKKS